MYSKDRIRRIALGDNAVAVTRPPISRTIEVVRESSVEAVATPPPERQVVRKRYVNPTMVSDSHQDYAAHVGLRYSIANSDAFKKMSDELNIRGEEDEVEDTKEPESSVTDEKESVLSGLKITPEKLAKESPKYNQHTVTVKKQYRPPKCVTGVGTNAQRKLKRRERMKSHEASVM